MFVPGETESIEQTLEADPNSDTVDVHEASIEDLDAALENAQAEETNAAPLDDSAPAATDEDPNASEVQEPTGQPAPTAKAAEAGVATPGANPSKPARVYTQEEIQAIDAENKRLKEQGDQKELFIQRRGTELGTLKGQLAAAKQQLSQRKAQLENGLEDKFAENPVQASNDRDEIKRITEQLEAFDTQEQRATTITEAQTYFLRHVDTEKVSIEDVAAVLKSDGLDDQYVSQFKANPWEFTTPEALVQMGKRAMDRKELVQADTDRRVLAKHVLAQNEEIKRLKTRSGSVVGNIQKHLNAPPPVTAQSAANPKTVRDVDPTKMSLAELDANIKSSMQVVNQRP